MSGYFMAVKSAIAKAVAALSASLAANTGAGLVGFKQAGSGSVQRTAKDKMQEVVSVKDFGAVGDGLTDDTAAIQLALNSGAAYVTGGNLQYVVTTIFPKSNQTLENIRLLEKPSAAAVSMTPVVSISNVSNVTLSKVLINGNRQNLQNIYTGNGEDGGMHGIRIGAGANNIKLLDCETSYCGSAGLALHDGASTTTATYSIKNVYVKNLISTYNREHGFFGDSFDGFTLTGVVSSYNGIDLNTTDALSHGNRGCRAGGNLFGAGFDLESYTGYPGSYMKNFFGLNIVCQGNALCSQIYAPNPTTENAEIPVSNIFIKNSVLEKGVASNATINSFSIYANSYTGSKYGVDTVHLSGKFTGNIFSNNAANISFSEGFIVGDASTSYKATIDNGMNIAITVPSNKDSILVETFGAPSVATNTGVGTLSTSINQLVKANGKHSIIMPIAVSGGLISGGNMSWTVTLPAQIKGAVNAVINAWNSTSGKSVIANVSVISANQLRIFMTPIDDSIQGNLELEVMF